MIEDNFLDDFERYRAHCDRVRYTGEVCPIDDKVYPGISTDIPDHIRQEICFKIEYIMGCDIYPKYMFMRLTTAGEYVPHQAHNDAAMAQWTFLLYLNREDHCKGGTDFVRHVDGNDLEAWPTDHNIPEKWEIVEMCEMKENRACIFEAHKMHRAQPLGGFGTDREDGRLVLVCFFDADPISH